MKKGISGFNRTMLILLSTILISISVLLVVLFVEDSTMIVEYGGINKTYFIPFYERDNTEYEDSEIFDYIYRSSVEDIIRMCVIKNQMETDGSYDPKKEIDISAFANRNSVVYDKELTATYYLDDLINWGNKSFDMQEVNSETMPFDVDTDTVSILVSRYKSVEGKDLISYAENMDEYNILVGNLKATAESLFNNYVEYMGFKENYGVGKTNMLYCFQMYNNGKLVRYTNLENIDSKMTTDDISAMFLDKGKYVYFNPDKMTIATNTKISALDMKGMTGKYSYSFLDNSRIWIGFDSSYSAQDGFALSRDYYEGRSGNSNGVAMIVCIWISFFAYLSLLMYLIMKEGRFYIKKNAEAPEITEKVKLKKADHMPIEFTCVVAFGIFVMDALIAYVAYRYVFRNLYGGALVYAAAMGAAAIINLTFIPVLMGLVRRIKAGNLGENSCIVWLVGMIRKTTVDAYDHGHAVIRTWIPYIIFLLANLILLLLGKYGFIVALIIDLIIGSHLYKNNKERQEIIGSINTISGGDIKHQINVDKMHGDNLELGNAVNNIGNGIRKAVETSMKDEKMKADLITNVSHDIKTPLTSIINYVDLLKRENIHDEKISGYIDILDQKSQRLKQLTDDLVEASKISSGNIVLNFEKINLKELVNQSIGEYEDKFAEHGLKCRLAVPDGPVFISVDARSMFRIIENLYNNIYKYALQGTRVYIDIELFGVEGAEKVQLAVKNISENQLNMSAEELIERFKQGDESRQAEGSGLGLSIAKSLTEAMNGQFDLFLDGDLFKVILTFNTV
ncbi:MAG: HAMP domain-containing histidine kinase [Lachnospiraceae bacterium]|nr:HAMP domain-containing histidine kinase [Lachnospiraceae bacterium]